MQLNCYVYAYASQIISMQLEFYNGLNSYTQAA
jgi:hypothetical protein